MDSTSLSSNLNTKFITGSLFPNQGNFCTFVGMSKKELTPILYKDLGGTSYHDETPTEVCSILEGSRLYSVWITIHYGDPITGLTWGQKESGIMYRAGDPELLPRLSKLNRIGNPPILDHHIVMITDRNGRIKYRHDAYHTNENLHYDKVGVRRS